MVVYMNSGAGTECDEEWAALYWFSLLFGVFTVGSSCGSWQPSGVCLPLVPPDCGDGNSGDPHQNSTSGAESCHPQHANLHPHTPAFGCHGHHPQPRGQARPTELRSDTDHASWPPGCRQADQSGNRSTEDSLQECCPCKYTSSYSGLWQLMHWTLGG